MTSEYIDTQKANFHENIESEAWKFHADSLADWAWERYVVREDCYAKYAMIDGKIMVPSTKERWDKNLIADHFRYQKIASTLAIFTTSLEDQCKVLTLDFDKKPRDPDSLATKNLAMVMGIFSKLVSQGFQPLLWDSNGRGGYHLDVFFEELVPAATVIAFGESLVGEWESFGLTKKPEVFPKQAKIDGKFGNSVRLIGEHPEYDWFSKVWNGHGWLAGEEAIKFLLSKNGDPVNMIPELPVSIRIAGAIPEVESESNWFSKYRKLSSLDLIGLMESHGYEMRPVTDRKYETDCPWHAEHTNGDSTASILLPDEQNDLFPAFHCFHDHCRSRSIRDVLDLFPAREVNRFCDSVENVIEPDNPLATAKLFLRDKFFIDGKSHLVYQKRFLHWDGKKYVEVEDDEIKADAYQWLSECNYYGKASGTTSKLIRFKPNRNSVASLLDALKAIANIPAKYKQPSWLVSELDKPKAIIAFNNGLLDLDRFLQVQNVELDSHTPDWFSSNCLPHCFDAKALCPNWLSFLDDVFEEDEERKRALAQWFGYNLTLDTSMQKFVFLIGPPRSGKGTTMRVLSALIGKENIATPTLTSLGGRFGMQSLLGKQSAIIPDAHIGRNADSIAVLERLKSIVGCDDQNVDRKSKDELSSVKINVRFTIAANEMPRLPDSSVSLKDKMVIIPYNKTYAGNEDYELTEKLLLEIPGITNWALNGLIDLRKSRRFIQPSAGTDLLQDFTRLSSPVAAFLEDCCELAPNLKSSTDIVFRCWERWCYENGHERGSHNSFGNKLRSSIPNLKRIKVRDGSKSFYVYSGLRLNTEYTEKINNNSLPL